MVRVFWAAPRIPSRLKLGARLALTDVGDFRTLFAPFWAFSWGEGISMEKPSLVGRGKALFLLPPPFGLFAADAVTVPVPE